GKTDKLLVTVNPILLTSIVVLPETMSLFVRESDTFEVTAYYNNDTTKNVTNENDCVYSSSDDSVAEVVSDPFAIAQGWVKAFKAGTATITATYTEGGVIKTDEILVTVSAVGLDYIEVEPDEVTLRTDLLTGISQQLEVTATYSDGFTSDITSDCDYVSNDSSIAIVDDNGWILAKGLGTTTITVTYATDWVVVVPVTVEVVPYSFTNTQPVNDLAVGQLVTTVAEDGDWMVWTFDFPVEEFTGDGNLNVGLIIALDGEGQGPAFQI
ncbi:unnamed protein product, partial [marine sediment metagenome]